MVSLLFADTFWLARTKLTRFLDSTVRIVYGRQGGVEVGFNPQGIFEEFGYNRIQEVIDASVGHVRFPRSRGRSRSLKRCFPALILDFTVPSGIPRSVEISRYFRPSRMLKITGAR